MLNILLCNETKGHDGTFSVDELQLQMNLRSQNKINSINLSILQLHKHAFKNKTRGNFKSWIIINKVVLHSGLYLVPCDFMASRFGSTIIGVDYLVLDYYGNYTFQLHGQPSTGMTPKADVYVESLEEPRVSRIPNPRWPPRTWIMETAVHLFLVIKLVPSTVLCQFDL